MNAAPLDSSRISHSMMLIGCPLCFVWPCLAGGLVVVRVVWGMRAPPLMGLADGEQLVVSDWACAELCLE